MKRDPRAELQALNEALQSRGTPPLAFGAPPSAAVGSVASNRAELCLRGLHRHFVSDATLTCQGVESLVLTPSFACDDQGERVYLRGGIGVGAFKRIFGGRMHRGTCPERFATGSGSIARHILKELETLKIIEKVPNSKGRRITPQGQRDLDSIAGQIGQK